MAKNKENQINQYDGQDTNKGVNEVQEVQEVIRESTFEAMEENDLYKEAEDQLAKTQENLMKFSYDILVRKVNEAREADADVSDIEEQMPDLLKKITRKEAEDQLAKTQENLMKLSYDILVRKVNEAKEAGADVFDIEEQMPELLKRCVN